MPISILRLNGDNRVCTVSAAGDGNHIELARRVLTRMGAVSWHVHVHTSTVCWRNIFRCPLAAILWWVWNLDAATMAPAGYNQPTSPGQLLSLRLPR
jgi:hypothetical protein